MSACAVCFENDGFHKMDCPQRYAVVGEHTGRGHYSQHTVSGNVAQLYRAGKPSSFHAPLISHVEGNLYQGGCKQDVELGDDFVGVVSLYPWERYQIGDETERVEYRMHDSSTGVDWDDLDEASNKALEFLAKGKTLIHCQAGLNRSGLVTAVVLMKQGRTAQEAIDLLRRSRSPMVLCNETFVKQLFELEDAMEASK